MVRRPLPSLPTGGMWKLVVELLPSPGIKAQAWVDHTMGGSGTCNLDLAGQTIPWQGEAGGLRTYTCVNTYIYIYV